MGGKVTTPGIRATALAASVLLGAMGIAPSAHGQSCSVTCPAGAVTEPEPCGQLLNDGCNLATPVYTSIACGQTVCGTSWADQGNRDTDWYTFSVTDANGDGQAEITASLTAEFPAQLFILNDDCANPLAFAQGQTDNCQTVTINACVTAPGTYRIWVAPGTAAGGLYEGVFCGVDNSYVVSASCGDVCTGPANDTCANAQPIVNGTEYINTVNATTDGPAHPSCDFGDTGDTQVHKDIWFSYVASCTGDLIIDACNSVTFDTRIAVYDGCACPPTEQDLIVCNDEMFGCDGGSSALFAPVVAGQCYLIRVGGFDGQEGLGTITLSCNAVGVCNTTGDCTVAHATPGCQDPGCCQTVCAFDQFCCLVEWDDLCAQQAATSCNFDPTEACCMGDGTCQQLTAADCATAGGTAQGAGTSCSSFSCSTETAQACCLVEGICILTTPSDCAGFGGSAQGDGLVCADVTCLLDACCLPDETCVELTTHECLAAGGTPGAAGSDCVTTTCGSLDEACCLTAEVCINTDAASCLGFGGQPGGPGTVCNAKFCDPCPEDVAPQGAVDGVVGVSDFLAVLAAWGPCAACPEDTDGDGFVGIADFLGILASWGACP